MEIKWEVYDGYVTGGRPQYTELDEDELLGCEDEDAVKDLIDECVRASFEDRVGFEYTDHEIDKVITEWKELRASQNEDDKDNE